MPDGTSPYGTTEYWGLTKKSGSVRGESQAPSF
jgi:hypothetical protein